MKFLITGDWHIHNAFKTRKDDTFLTFCDKIGQIIITAQGFGCQAILQPGDFFESHKANDFLKQHFISLIKSAQIPIYTVYGQHDLRYHTSSILNTPLRVLQSSGTVEIIRKEPLICSQDNVAIFGASWFENVPDISENKAAAKLLKPTEKATKSLKDYGIDIKKIKYIKILIVHKMIVDEKIWEGQEDHEYANTFLKKHKAFDLIVSGDNHKTFTAQSGRRWLVNAGSLLRTRIDQAEHKPCVFLYDTDDMSLSKIELNVDKFENVIRVEEAEKEKEENETLKKFVAMLSKDTQLTGIDYRKNIKTWQETNKSTLEDSVKLFMDQVLIRLDRKSL